MAARIIETSRYAKRNIRVVKEGTFQEMQAEMWSNLQFLTRHGVTPFIGDTDWMMWEAEGVRIEWYIEIDS